MAAVSTGLAAVNLPDDAEDEKKLQGDNKAFIRHRGNSWTFGTAFVERIVALDNGRLLMKSFRDPVTGYELMGPETISDEFCFWVDGEAEGITGASGDWRLIGSSQKRSKHGERQLDISIARNGVVLTKSYLVYPGSSIIREWVAIKNTGGQPITIKNPGFMRLSMRLGVPSRLQFHWITGGENQDGSWDLRTEKLPADKPRRFDSYDPFPFKEGKEPGFPGDGINAMILLNDKPIWPASGWQYVPNATVTVPFEVTADVNRGDKLIFMVNMNHNIGWDTTAFNPTITYSDGESHIASAEFSDEQGKNGWYYQYRQDGRYINLVYYPTHKQWRKAVDNATGTPFIGPDSEHPDVNQDVSRVWVAPHSGHVRITGSVCNTGNTNGYNPSYGFRPGTSSYAPWASLYGLDSGEGIFWGWDYFGHWTSNYQLNPSGAVLAGLNVAGFQKTLAPGESVNTPRSFTGLYRGDLDNAGNECLNWQYRYLWDYTRKDWFPGIRLLGYWYKGTGWNQPGVSWLGGDPDFGSTFRKVFRVVDLMREVGGDVYHRDWGWWDRAGDWNGPDFRSTGNYLRKYGMGQLIYAFLYTVDPKSKVGREHPEWLIGDTLDMSRPEVVRFISGQLDEFVKRWGRFEWRNDSFFTAPIKNDDTPELGQDEGFRETLRGFLDRHPECAFQAVNGGGNYCGYDYVHYSSCIQFTDGAAGILGNYYASLLFPPDKTCHQPDMWNPTNYDKATWRGLLCINFDMTGDTWDPEKLEGIRLLVDIYHYLFEQGVVGRWVQVYRPIIKGDDPTMYLQRLSGDGLRRIIVPKRPPSGAITIRPKGLIPDAKYLVSFQEADGTQKWIGRDLMEHGIHLDPMRAGELIYLNLPMHPGSKLDTEPPTSPTAVKKRRGVNMGYPGIELTWESSTDNNWVSYYEIFRDGERIDWVAKGRFYFDHSAGADLAANYEVRSVDGAGNVSRKSSADGLAAKRAMIYDDQVGNCIEYQRNWQRENDLQPAYEGTISLTKEKGARAELTFTGKKVLLFSKLSADCGIAGVSVDGGPVEKVDTYSADDIWGVCVFQKQLKTTGPHRLSLEVLGERSKRSNDCYVYLDGIRVEPD